MDNSCDDPHCCCEFYDEKLNLKGSLSIMVSIPAGTDPSPPASHTAAARRQSCTPAMGAWIRGSVVLNREDMVGSGRHHGKSNANRKRSDRPAMVTAYDSFASRRSLA